MKQIETGQWHAILDALNLAPESTPIDVVDRIELLEAVHIQLQRTFDDLADLNETMLRKLETM